MNNENLLRFLVELRKRLLSCVIFLTLIFAVLLYFTNDIYTWLAQPLLKYSPHGLIATNIAAPFVVPFELTFFAALFAAVPFLLYQLWAFIAPALYQHEKRLVWPLLLMSTLLFYAGVAFAYFVIFPLLFKFLTHTAPQGVVVSPDISQYLEFSLKLFFVFGTIFEVPVVIIILIYSNVVTRMQFIRFRPYAIIAAFVLGMMLAPPDVFSQTLLAVPLWMLFEIGVFLGRFVKR